MRIEHKGDRVTMSENEYGQIMNELNQYKKAYQHCVDDLIVLRANNKRLERENAEQFALLKEFSKFIDYKLYIHPGNCTYLSYRNELDQLGICKESE